MRRAARQAARRRDRVDAVPFEPWELHASVHGRIQRVAARQPRHLALCAPHRRLTYAQLEQAADRLAHLIRQTDAPTDRPVAIGPGMDMVDAVVAVLAVLKSGRFYLYLSATFPPERIRDMLEDSRPGLMLTDDGSETACAALLADLPRADVPVMLNVASAGVSADPVCADVASDALLALHFTSGTTGRPKGIMITHERYLRSARGSMLGPGSRVAALVNFNVGGVLAPLMRGAVVYPFNPNAGTLAGLLDWLRRERITTIAPPVSLFRRMADAMPDAGRLPDLRQLFLYGQAVLPADVARFRAKFDPSCRLFVLYSTTETFGITRLCIGPRYVPSGSGAAVGDPVKGKDVLLLDDAGREVAAGAVGEVAVRSRHLSPGYWNQPRLTRERFACDADDPSLRTFLTGDLGRRADNGCLILIGRKDRQVKVRGFRVELETVEAALCALDGIDEAAVTAREDGAGERRLAAYLVPLPGASGLVVADIRRRLAEDLPAYMIPSWINFLDRLPTLPNFKVDFAALPVPRPERAYMSTRFEPSSTALECELLACWRRVLGTDELGVGDDFGEWGGDSLRAAALVADLERSLGVTLPEAAVAGLTTVRRMAQLVESHRGLRGDGVAEFRRHLDPDRFSRLLSIVRDSGLPPVRDGSLISVLNRDGRRPPLFWCFNAPASEPAALAGALGPDQPLYCLYSGILAIRPFDDAFVRRLAAHYRDEMRMLRPAGPWLLGGNCSGARVMIEIALRLLADREPAPALCVMETFDSRLFGYPGPLTLLYGRESHLQSHRAFRWPEPGWERTFRVLPSVHWINGPHAEFFQPDQLPALAERVGAFLAAYGAGEEGIGEAAVPARTDTSSRQPV